MRSLGAIHHLKVRKTYLQNEVLIVGFGVDFEVNLKQKDSPKLEKSRRQESANHRDKRKQAEDTRHNIISKGSIVCF